MKFLLSHGGLALRQRWTLYPVYGATAIVFLLAIILVAELNEMAGREKLFLAINIVGKACDHLDTVIASRKLAQAELRELAQVAGRTKRFGIL